MIDKEKETPEKHRTGVSNAQRENQAQQSKNTDKAAEEAAEAMAGQNQPEGTAAPKRQEEERQDPSLEKPDIDTTNQSVPKADNINTEYPTSGVETPPRGTPDIEDKPDEAQIAAAAPEEDAADMPVSPAVDHTLPTDNVKDIDEPDDSNVTSEHHEEEEDEDEDEGKDYSHLSKKELVKAAQELLHYKDVRKADRELTEIKNHLDELHRVEREEALAKFQAEGGDPADFNFKGDEHDQRFESVFQKIKEEKNKFFAQQQKSKEDNLRRKNEILAQLRDFVDSEETNTSLRDLKKLQEEWKTVGPVPPQYNNSLWASYNALIDRFYNNRSILYELKELDRKKNLEAKQDIVSRAERLLTYDNMKQATRELRDLHEEYKHVGPVPREFQEALWLRFKEISDKIYEKRRNHLEQLNKELEENLIKKRELGDRVQEFLEFNSDRITDWNDKTKELLEVQREWETIGGLPRQVAKEVNKYFWSAFKGFFSNKNKFFKDLEKKREENLQLKEELVNEAEALKESNDWHETAERFKDLQKRWKTIGPVPEKQRDEVYKKFKAAADTFFERKRSQGKETNKEFEENLRRKEEIIAEIENLAAKGDQDIDKFFDLQDAYEDTGFVPRNAIGKIKTAYSQATEKFLGSLTEMPEEEKEKIRLQTQINRIKSGPDANRKLRQRESNIRRQISKIENDISIWRNNLEFFAESKNADKLKSNFEEKIEEATIELEKLKEQLRIVRENEE